MFASFKSEIFCHLTVEEKYKCDINMAANGFLPENAQEPIEENQEEEPSTGGSKLSIHKT